MGKFTNWLRIQRNIQNEKVSETKFGGGHKNLFSVPYDFCEGNQIGATGAAALAKALEFNSSLTSLNLSDNEIKEKGAAALAKALKSNSSLTSLNLNANQIKDTGATALAKTLESNSSLTLEF